MVFEFGEQDGMRMWLEDDASSVVFHGGVVQKPRVCLALDELVPVNEVRQACEAPEPAKSVQILFRGQHGLGVWKLAAEQSFAEWYSGGELVGDWRGTVPRLEGRSRIRRSATLTNKLIFLRRQLRLDNNNNHRPYFFERIIGIRYQISSGCLPVRLEEKHETIVEGQRIAHVNLCIFIDMHMKIFIYLQ